MKDIAHNYEDIFNCALPTANQLSFTTQKASKEKLLTKYYNGLITATRL
jgi:hypothetical protein